MQKPSTGGTLEYWTFEYARLCEERSKAQAIVDLIEVQVQQALGLLRALEDAEEESNRLSGAKTQLVLFADLMGYHLWQA